MGADALSGYFREAASWDADRLAQALRSARRAWQVAAAGWGCAVASALALALLMPLKRVDPFVVRVDRSTGIVDVVPLYDAHAGHEQSVTRYFLTHYISVCERFNFATAESEYQRARAGGIGEFLRARQRRKRSGAGALSAGRATGEWR
jgi:type IV secretion system protein VirB8